MGGDGATGWALSFCPPPPPHLKRWVPLPPHSPISEVRGSQVVRSKRPWLATWLSSPILSPPATPHQSPTEFPLVDPLAAREKHGLPIPLPQRPLPAAAASADGSVSTMHVPPPPPPPPPHCLPRRVCVPPASCDVCLPAASGAARGRRGLLELEADLAPALGVKEREGGEGGKGGGKSVSFSLSVSELLASKPRCLLRSPLPCRRVA
jgi:hypothetical protein